MFSCLDERLHKKAGGIKDSSGLEENHKEEANCGRIVFEVTQ